MTTGIQAQADGTVAARIDVVAERELTAGTLDRHYFNAAGAGLMSNAVADAVVGHIREEQRVGGYEAANAARESVESVYTSAAELLGSQSDEIALVDSATTGLRSLFDGLRLGAGDVVIAPRSSYVSQALRLLALRDLDGVELVVLPNVADGSVDLDALDEALARAGSRAVISGVHIPTSSGLVEPVAEIGMLSRKHGARYILDATQSIGQVEVDVEEIGCDALVTTGRKFLRGPRGTGIVYVRQSLMEALVPWAPDVRGTHWTGFDSWESGRGARTLETWEASIAGRVGLGVALREAIDRGMPATEAHLIRLGTTMREALAAVPGVTVVDPLRSPSSIVTFTVDGVGSREVTERLRAARVDSITIPAAHAQWDLGDRGIPSVVRVSGHVYNDEADLDAFTSAVAEIASSGAA